jgi:hypothetical protein
LTAVSLAAALRPALGHTPERVFLCSLTIRQKTMHDDDEDVMPYEKPLDLDLAFDGTDDPHDLHDNEPPQDGAGDALGDTPQAEEEGAWEIVMAERDDAGEWRTVGEPVPDVDFTDQGLAYDFAESRNRREFGRRFCWTTDPSKAWVMVQAGMRGRL